jgi:hypothetical protein
MTTRALRLVPTAADATLPARQQRLLRCCPRDESRRNLTNNAFCCESRRSSVSEAFAVVAAATRKVRALPVPSQQLGCRSGHLQQRSAGNQGGIRRQRISGRQLHVSEARLHGLVPPGAHGFAALPGKRKSWWRPETRSCSSTRTRINTACRGCPVAPSSCATRRPRMRCVRQITFHGLYR